MKIGVEVMRCDEENGVKREERVKREGKRKKRVERSGKEEERVEREWKESEKRVKRE